MTPAFYSEKANHKTWQAVKFKSINIWINYCQEGDQNFVFLDIFSLQRALNVLILPTYLLCSIIFAYEKIILTQTTSNFCHFYFYRPPPVAASGWYLPSGRLQHRCFHVKFEKFIRTPDFTEHLRWLALASHESNTCYVELFFLLP